MTQKDPAARYQTAAELESDLTKWLQQDDTRNDPMVSTINFYSGDIPKTGTVPIRTRQRRKWLAIIGAVAIIGGTTGTYIANLPPAPSSGDSGFIALPENATDEEIIQLLEAHGCKIARIPGVLWDENSRQFIDVVDGKLKLPEKK